MLTEDIQECCNRISNINFKRARNQQAQEVQRTDNSFFTHWAKLKEQTNSYLAAKELGFEVDKDTKQQLINAFIVAKNAFLQSGIEKSGLVEFSTNVNSISTSLTNSWSSFPNKIDKTIYGKLQVLKTIDKYRNDCQTFLRISDYLYNWPLKKQTVKAYITNLETIKKMVDDVKFDDEIEQFLIKASENKASIQDLTPKILNWIKELKLEQSFSVSI